MDMKVIVPSYDGGTYTTSTIDCWCTRWKKEGDQVTVETFLDPSDVDTIDNGTIPGLIMEEETPLGWKINLDSSYSSGNTIILDPKTGEGLDNTRDRTVMVVKEFRSTFLTPDKMTVKLGGKERRGWGYYT